MSMIFKGAVWVFAVFCALIIVIAAFVTSDVMTSFGVIIPVAIIAWIILRNRSRRKEMAADLPEGRRRSAPHADDNIFLGHGAQIEMRVTGISIARSGGASLVLHGLKGEKRIAYSSITAIQFRDATKMMSGYIQFSILGGNESRAGIWDATKDENTVMFTQDQSESFHKLRDLVEERMHPQRSISGASQSSSYSAADEITKLADLHERGYLSDEEFASKKTALLNT